MLNRMLIREYISSECERLAELFFQTVHTVNAKDYIKEQLNVWATGNVDLSVWNNSFLEHYTLVALENNVIVGFGDIDAKGCLDKLYTHKDYQKTGIATAICNQLEQSVSPKIITIARFYHSTHFF